MTDEKDEHPQAARIRERAYMIWERDGRPDGHALMHWVKAREEVEAEDKQAAADNTPAKGNKAG
ncbi:MAG: DUF2934 domain-containing protein [Aestuariivirga sp.]|uniref:DUF2934 domain-containing protein n=1 Tax=Aestuariivirga sp. TaxID=2650926 RepID=UPI00301911F8